MVERELYEKELSIADIWRQTGVPLSTVRSRLIRQGTILRTMRESVNLAFVQGKMPNRKGLPRPPFTEEWRANMSKAKMGKHAGRAAAGISQKKNGYREFTTGPNKYRSEHVILMETQIGRKLFTEEIVHHIDGNSSNNDLSNLKLMTRSAHTKLHRLQEGPREKNQHGQFFNPINPHVFIPVSGERNGNAILTEANAKTIIQSPLSSVDLAAKFNVTKSHIESIRSGRRWKHIERNNHVIIE